MTTFTRTWDASYEANPPNNQDARLGALRIREVREDVRERGEVDHSWAGDAHDGKHLKATFRPSGGDPTLDADDFSLYAKAIDGITTLFWKDESGNVGRLVGSSYLAQAGSLLVTSAHQNKFIGVTAAATLTFDPIADLGAAFCCFIYNAHTAAITLDPDGSEQVDGRATLSLNPGEGCWIFNTGSMLRTIGRTFNGVQWTISTSAPSGGADGDIWFEREA